MDGLVKGLVWVGSRTEHYEQMVEFYRDTLIYQKGSGGPQKPFSWLSEGVRGMFTINTEAGERLVFPTSTSSAPPPCPRGLVAAGAGGYSLGTSPRNVCRNAWETVVL
jgi:hypothetical protein